MNWWYAQALEGHITGLTPKGALNSLTPHYIYGQPLKRLFFFAYLFLLPVNGSVYSFIVIWSISKSYCIWFLMYSCIAVLFRPTVSAKYPLHQKWRLPYLYFRFACRSKIIRVLFPLRYPMNCDTLRCGGIHTNIWTWSEHASASRISTFFSSQSFLSILPTSSFSWPYISFRLNFGANTIWYWHLLLNATNSLFLPFCKNFLLFFGNAVVKPLPFYNMRFFYC